MPEYVEALKTGDMTDGSLKLVKLQGRPIVISRIGGKFYAAENPCPHAGGNLSGGKLESNVVTCPRHGSQFNLTTGQLLRWTHTPVKPADIGVNPPKSRNLKTFPVKVQGDSVMVEI